MILPETALGRRLRQLRHTAGLTLGAAADRLGRTAACIARVEKYGQIPGPELLHGMAHVYGTSPDPLKRLAVQAITQKHHARIAQRYGIEPTSQTQDASERTDR